MDYVFTAHNIRLADGTQTHPASPNMDQYGRYKAAKRALNVIYNGDLEGRTIADVGCLEGGYTTEFARLGMEATGIEVRDSNFRNCLLVKSRTSLPNLHFLQRDALEIGQCGDYDGLFVCGLLYHLDKPRKFLEDAAKVCKKFIIIDTHVAPRMHEPAVDIFRLSDTSTNEGLKGRWFTEFDAAATAVDRDNMKWSSFANNASFWIEKTALLQTMSELGFDMVFEQFDCEDDIETQFTRGDRYNHSRVFLVGVKTGVSIARAQ
ncbi:SAM-dependent methyltransferase [Rhodoblastus sphagnicola]|uniref:class I SAM-dependent methyltransferase n=1 Tax=Rhodoblastus sphagnicola TaxID=333368 RepID=UPI0013048436|nr:methyltransferase domain-containing protein [Rhodoblastus sphagnicola]MBB4198225.1 SAM-dependent methyltransferase [Rhodoblastus sphagnicola]